MESLSSLPLRWISSRYVTVVAHMCIILFTIVAFLTEMGRTCPVGPLLSDNNIVIIVCVMTPLKLTKSKTLQLIF